MFPVNHLLSIASFLLGLVLVSKILREKRHPGSTVAWLLVIVLIPYVGIPLYLIFGGRKIKRIAAEKETLYLPVDYKKTPEGKDTVERILLSTGVPPKSSGNDVKLLESGNESYQDLINLIEEAKSFIHLTTYILGSDDVGASVVKKLAEKARQGLQVRVLLDGFGCLWVKRAYLAEIRNAGGKVSFFMPFVRIPFTGNSNLRNHRKLVVADGQRAQLGGRNIAREYMGPGGVTKNLTEWCDLSLSVRGPIVKVIDDIFRSDWKFASREDLSSRVEPSQIDGGASAQVVASGPDIAVDAYYDAIVSAVFGAERRFWVVTPYLILDETLMRAMELAARRGVDVRIIVPAKSNHFVADIGRGAYIRQLKAVGASIFFYQPRMLHAKVIVIDDDCAVIGSANMDIRSMLLNYEISVFMYSNESILETSRWVDRLLIQCGDEIEVSGVGRDLIENLVRIFAPLL
jgi:cardiolipin synthase A/B